MLIIDQGNSYKINQLSKLSEENLKKAFQILELLRYKNRRLYYGPYYCSITKLGFCSF